MATDPPLYTEVADPGSLRPFGAEAEAGNPAGWPGYPDQLRRARQATGAPQAVTTGLATVGGQPCVLAGFEFGFLGGSIGTAEGARIAEAFAVAAARRLPMVSVAASGGTRMQEGTVALAQMQTAAAAVVQARRAGIPHIAVAGDPTTGGVWSSLIASADLVFSVPRARVSFSGSRTRPAGADPAARGVPCRRPVGPWLRRSAAAPARTAGRGGRRRPAAGTGARSRPAAARAGAHAAGRACSAAG